MMAPKSKSRAKKHTKIENLSMLGTLTRMAPAGLYVYAEDFLESYKSLPSAESPFSPSRYYLVIRSIELSLKAFLSCSGYSLEMLSGGPLGHDLIALMNECEKGDIEVISDLKEKHKKEIHAASEYYIEKVFEYPAIGEAVRAYPKAPDLSILAEAAAILVKYIKEPCLNA
jgi:hypothetical protein